MVHPYLACIRHYYSVCNFITFFLLFPKFSSSMFLSFVYFFEITKGAQYMNMYMKIVSSEVHENSNEKKKRWWSTVSTVSLCHTVR